MKQSVQALTLSIQGLKYTVYSQELRYTCYTVSVRPNTVYGQELRYACYIVGVQPNIAYGQEERVLHHGRPAEYSVWPRPDSTNGPLAVDLRASSGCGVFSPRARRWLANQEA